MSCETETILRNIRIVERVDGVNANNGIVIDPSSGYVQLGAPLIKDTDITGSFTLNLGTTGSKLSNLLVKTSVAFEAEYSNGVNAAKLNISSSGIIITDTLGTPRGIIGASNYSTNYTDNTYTQKIYVDSTIGGKNVNALVKAPTVAQNGYAITWDNAATEYKLTAMLSTAGATTQVIYNDAGTLVGSANFTFSSNTLSIPDLNLGHGALAGATRTIAVLSSVTNTELVINTKGSGNFTIGIEDGILLFGKAAYTATDYKIRVQGSSGTIGLYIEPKGTEGEVYFGSSLEAGGFRYLTVTGSSANIGFVISGKGSGTGRANVSEFIIGNETDSLTQRRLYAITDVTITDLVIAGKGVSSTILIGRHDEAATDRHIRAYSSASNTNLNIHGRGTGRVYTNGWSYEIFDLGNWNMDTTDSITINTGIPITRIKGAIANIIRDDGQMLLNALNIDIRGISFNNVEIRREIGGDYDGILYDSPAFNRGQLIIFYST